MTEEMPAAGSGPIPPSAVESLDALRETLASAPVATPEASTETPATPATPEAPAAAPAPEAPVTPSPEEPVAETKKKPDRIPGSRPTPPPVDKFKSSKFLSMSVDGLTDSFADASVDNRGRIRKMFDAGRGLVSKIYEGIYKLPVVSRLAGKMEIAFSQALADRQEAKAFKLKAKMESIDLKRDALGQAQERLSQVLDDLKSKKVPGVDSLNLKLREIEDQRVKLLGDRDRVQSKLEKRENKARLHTNERDRVADKLINRYKEKLEPLNERLDNLERSRKEAHELIAENEERHNRELAEIAIGEGQIKEISAILKLTGAEDSEIRSNPAIKELNKQILSGRESIKRDRAEMAEKLDAIDREVAAVDAKANPYRDRRDEFVRIKSRRLFDLGVKTRGAVVDSSVREEIVPGFRTVASESDESPESPEDTESVEDHPDLIPLNSLVSGWNDFLVKTYGKVAIKDKVLNLKEFAAKRKLDVAGRIELDDFTAALNKYYFTDKKMPADAERDFKKTLRLFLEGLKTKK